MFAVLGVLATLLGLWDFLSVRLEIEPFERLGASRPFSQVFTVRNDAFYRLADVQPGRCYLTLVRVTDYAIARVGAEHVAMEPAKVLRAGEPMSTMCVFEQTFGTTRSDGSEATVTFADVCVEVTYHPITAWLPEQRQMRRFSTVPDEGGNLLWVPRALEDACSQPVGTFRRVDQPSPLSNPSD